MSNQSMNSLPRRPDGFTYRDVHFSKTGGIATYRVSISNIDEELDFVYGVASYNVKTDMAEEIPDRGWYNSHNGRVDFPILIGNAFVVTSNGRAESKETTPA